MTMNDFLSRAAAIRLTTVEYFPDSWLINSWPMNPEERLNFFHKATPAERYAIWEASELILSMITSKSSYRG